MGAPAGFLTREDAQLLIAQALDDARQVESFNPFARSHHSDLTAATGALGALALSPSSKTAERAVKVTVAAFYGLTDPDPNYLVDMLGNRALFHEVTRAHLYPKSYQNFHEFASYLSLPAPFLTGTDPRNFLLIDKELHDAFDAGFVAFIPVPATELTIRVFRPARVSARVAGLDGQRLRWPTTASQPYRRILGWCAWLAKGAEPVDDAVGAELDAALDASDSFEGNTALKAAVEQALRINKVVRSWLP